MGDDANPDKVFLGGAVLDLARGTLTRDGQIVRLRSKSFRLLCELARRSGRVVSKDELLDAVWPGLSVTDDSRTQAIHDIRRSLDDRDQTLLRTVARRGFILVATQPPEAEPPPRLNGHGLLAPDWRPRIALLPLTDRTGNPEQGPVVDGLVEEVTNGLARFRNLTVLARHSAFAAAAEGLPLAEIGRRLKVDYVVDVTARLAEDGHLRLALALNDVATGELLWGDSFETEGSGWLTLQDLVPRRIVSRLFASVEEAGYRTSLRRNPGDLTAFENLARGKAQFRSFEPEANARALGHFAAAIVAAPTFGLAHSYHALADLALHDYGGAPLDVKQSAKARAIQGAELSPEESRCHGILGYCHALLSEFDPGEREATLAITLNPCDADALFGLAIVLVWRGASAEALPRIQQAKELNPLWPAHYDVLHAEALFHLGRYDESIRLHRRLPRLSARHEMRLAAAYALVGEVDLARHHAARARTREPSWDFVEKARHAHSLGSAGDVQRLVEGTELALRLLGER